MGDKGGEKETETEVLKNVQKGRTLVQPETSLEGSVKWHIYFKYLKSVGLLICAIILLCIIVMQGILAGGNVWLSLWADSNITYDPPQNGNIAYNLGFYGGLGGLGGFLIITSVIKDLIFYTSCANASNSIHSNLLRHVLTAPLRFFETNPAGRIINRFTADMAITDQAIPAIGGNLLWATSQVLAVMVVISVSTPIFVAFAVPVIAIYFLTQRFYISTSRQLKRLESVSKSSIFSFFNESLSGVDTIKSFGQDILFRIKFESSVDENVKCYYLNMASNRWLGLIMDNIGSLTLLLSSLLAVLDNNISPGLAGLSVTFALQISGNLNFMIRMICDMETNMVALERIHEYEQIEPESAFEGSDLANQEWPKEGKISFENVTMRYEPDHAAALNDISLELHAGEKLGICGRTGSGKTSLALALFRIVDPEHGHITIDGHNIGAVNLERLRSSLSIIPQEPAIFTGSVRFNLDPHAKFCDRQLWEALRHAHLKEYVASLEGGLQAEVSPRGDHLSQGQKQLLCLARALLRKSRVLVMDEATSAVDAETDKWIQAAVRKEFGKSTVVTIAHRLNTILECDRVAVLKDGKLAELAKPSELMANVKSEFYLNAVRMGMVGNALAEEQAILDISTT